MMKIDRLIGILSILLQKDKVTAPYLADKFEVSRRTINRDVENLCKAGIPLMTEQGKNGGISIMQEYKIDKTLLTSSDMQTILLGLKSLDSVSEDRRYQQLMDKLTGGNDNILTSDNHIYIDLSSGFRKEISKKIRIIQEAINQNKVIGFQYYSQNGETKREIEPKLLIFQWSSWYVWGYCLLRNDFRLFKLNRLEDLRIKEENVKQREIPEYLPNINDESDIQITVTFDASMKWRLIESFGVNSYETLKDGRLKMNVRWSDKESVFSWIMGFGRHATIEEPIEYREEYLKQLSEITKHYKNI